MFSVVYLSWSKFQRLVLSLSALLWHPFAVHMDFVSETVPDNVSHAIGSVRHSALRCRGIAFLMGLFSDLFWN